MGARGRLAEFPGALPLRLSPAHRYRLDVIAARSRLTLAAAVRQLIDEKWKEITSNDGQAPEVQSREG